MATVAVDEEEEELGAYIVGYAAAADVEEEEVFKKSLLFSPVVEYTQSIKLINT